MNQRKIGIFITYCTMVFNIVIGLVYTPYMLTKLGRSEYGVFSLASSLISFISLLDLGLGQTIVRYITKERVLGHKEREADLNGLFITLYGIIAFLALVIGIGVIVLYPITCKRTMSEQEIHVFRIVFSILLSNTVISFPLCVFSSTINSYERFFFLKFMNFVMTVLKYLCMFLLLFIGYRVIAIAVVTSVSSVSMQIFYVIYCVRKLHIKFRFGRYDSGMVREIFWFSFYIFLNLIIDFLYSNTDKLILGAVKGTIAVTVYSVGIYFQTYFQELSTAMSGVFMPKIVNLYEKNGSDMSKISDLFLRVGKAQMAILVLALSGFFLVGEEFIQLWVGEGYKDAYYIGLIIMVPALIPLTQNIGISVLRAMNMHKYRSYMYLAIAVFNVAVSIPLAGRYGGVGAAIGTCIGNLLGQILFMNWFYSVKIGLDIRGYWKNLLRYLGVIAPLVLVFWLLKKWIVIDTWYRFIIFAAVYTLLYLLLGYLFVANPDEKGLLKKRFL